jgi:hypothetical protein
VRPHLGQNVAPGLTYVPQLGQNGADGAVAGGRGAGDGAAGVGGDDEGNEYPGGAGAPLAVAGRRKSASVSQMMPMSRNRMPISPDQ